MAKTIAQKLAQQKYDQKSYDQILIKVRKGKKGEYQQVANEFGFGQAEMIRLAIEEFISNHAGEKLSPITQKESAEQKLSPSEKELVEEFNSLSPKSQKALREIISELVKSKGEA